jgi:hypothetical protein
MATQTTQDSNNISKFHKSDIPRSYSGPRRLQKESKGNKKERN